MVSQRPPRRPRTGRSGLTKFIAPLAALTLIGLAGCSGSEPTNIADANTSIETNLTSVDEPLANDVVPGNDASLVNDSTFAPDPALNGAAVDPTLNATGNTTGL